MTDIYIHIGLPKTATTTLQTSIFPNLEGVDYRGKHGGPRTDRSLWNSLAKCWHKFQVGEDPECSLEAWVQDALESNHRSILISDENLMQWRSPSKPKASPWFVKKSRTDLPRAGSHPIIEFLKLTSERLPEGCQLRVILTIRNQAEYMASLAAETGSQGLSFTNKVLANDDPSLKYFGIVDDLFNILGNQNLLLLFYEDGVDEIVRQIKVFTGAKLVEDSLLQGSHLNAKKIRDQVWKTNPRPLSVVWHALYFLNSTSTGRRLTTLSRKKMPWLSKAIDRPRVIRLSARKKKMIQAHYSYDNKQLGRLVGRDLTKLGY